MTRIPRHGLVSPSNPQGLPCYVCRPKGWITIWKRVRQILVLDR